MLKKKSFLERLTGNIRLEDETQEESKNIPSFAKKLNVSERNDSEHRDNKQENAYIEEDAQLTVDVYQTPSEIIVQSMVAGVQPENLSINITRDSISIRGKREENHSINNDRYVIQELYWGSFSRSISLPEEIDPEGAEAIEKHGLLIIKLPKVDKNKETKLRIKSI
jgi:HSP20 family protein